MRTNTEVDPQPFDRCIKEQRVSTNVDSARFFLNWLTRHGARRSTRTSRAFPPDIPKYGYLPAVGIDLLPLPS
jgi:hypothetical protein